MANLRSRRPRPNFSHMIEDEKTGEQRTAPVQAVIGMGVSRHYGIFPTDDGFSVDFWINPNAKDTEIKRWFMDWAAWHIYDYLQRRRGGITTAIKAERSWPGTADPLKLAKNRADLVREAKQARELAESFRQQGNFREQQNQLHAARLFEGYLGLLNQGMTQTPDPQTIQRRLKNLRGITVDRELIYNTLRPKKKTMPKKRSRVKTGRRTGKSR